MIDEIKHAGITENDHVLLHSSLSKIGWVVGKETTVVNAFLEVLNKGTLVMPSQTSDNSDPSQWENPPVPAAWVEVIKTHAPSFDPKTFPARGMGAVSNCFRNYPKVYRSNHPMDSFIAKGKYAKKITKNHALTPGMGENSPLGKLYQLSGKVCLLGVSYGNATIFHLAETLYGGLKMIDVGTAFKNRWQTFQDFDYDSDDFLALGSALESNGLVSKYPVGHTEMIVFEIRPAVDFAVEWFKETRI